MDKRTKFPQENEKLTQLFDEGSELCILTEWQDGTLVWSNDWRQVKVLE
jgi:hypothetical protein